MKRIAAGCNLMLSSFECLSRYRLSTSLRRSIIYSRFSCLLLILLTLLAGKANALAPQIVNVEDQNASQGSTYTFAPALSAGGSALWTKAYGPDAVEVNPLTGKLTWDIPESLASESFHLGVKATNVDGVAIETWIVTVGDGKRIYIGPNETVKTLKAGLASMASGDTLVLRNGTWLANGSDNIIPGPEAKTQAPPSGSPGAYTTLMAEDPGEVVLDGQNNSRLINLFGSTKHPDFALNTTFTGKTNYIAIKGLVLVNASTEGLRVNYSEHVKLIDIGIGSATAVEAKSFANVYIYRSRYILIEGMYVWGHGRYKIQFKDSSEGVVRRSVVRMDDIRIDDPVGGFISYCSKNIVFQNNIVVDGNSSKFWLNHNELAAAFGVPATNCFDYPEGNKFVRGLVLNSDIGVVQTQARENPSPTLWEDIVAWDIRPAKHNAGAGNYAPVHSGVGATLSNRLTVGEVGTSPGYYLYSRSLDSRITNSIFYRLGWDGDSVVDMGDLIRVTGAEFDFSYNAVAAFDGDNSDGAGSPNVSNSINLVPKFKYITKLPDNSPLRMAGENGSRVGAELLTMLGRSGTFYGDEGYETETNIPMWPFPAEVNAHKFMSAYSYTGPTQAGAVDTLSGARGFAVPGQTLSHYVWNYLGHIAPPLELRAVAADSSATLFWAPPPSLGLPQVRGYKVYRLDGDVKSLLAEVPKGTTVYRVDGLSNDVAVKFVVSAISTDGESDAVYPVSITPREGGPRALASAVENARVGDTVSLDGSASSHVDSLNMTAKWQQLSGLSVAMADPTALTTSFKVPEAAAGTTLSFALVLTDQEGSMDTAQVLVRVDSPDSPTVVGGPAPRSNGLGEEAADAGGGKVDSIFLLCFIAMAGFFFWSRSFSFAHIVKK